MTTEASERLGTSKAYGQKNLMKNSPKFKQPLWAFTLQERSYPEGVLILEATDLDSLNLTYSLANDYGVFHIDRNYGVLSVTAPEDLLIERLGEHINLTAIVSDEINNTDSAVVIITLEHKSNERLNPPIFNQTIYAFAARPGVKYVGQVSAEYSHGKITYHLSEGGAKAFSVNPSDGVIYYEGPLEKNAHNYTLKVEFPLANNIMAVDNSVPPRVDVTTVQVLIAGLESSPPRFITSDGIVITVEKDLSPEIFLYEFIAEDEDANAELHYTIDLVTVTDEIGSYVSDSVNYLEHFSFQNNGINNGRLQLSKSFRNTTVASVHLKIMVSDIKHRLEPGDELNFIINLMEPVQNISESELLQFPALSKKIVVSEDISIGSYIYTVNVKPYVVKSAKKYHIMYKLSEGQRYFSINSVTGVLTTIANLHFLPAVNVTILATLVETQRITSTTLQVIIIPSQRKRLPKFIADNFKFTIVENAPAGTVINSTAVTAENGDVLYSVEGKDSEFLTIDKEGVLHISHEVDREGRKQLAAFVRASRSKHLFSLVPVIINVDDEDDTAPLFTNRSYVASVMENSPVDTFILHTQAIDNDNSELSFSLMMNSGSEKLASVLRIDNTGTISNVEPLLGYSGEYQFAVTARDQSHSGASANVFLTIIPYTRCHPQFLPHIRDVFVMEENRPPSSLVAQLNAKVPNNSCLLYYSLLSGQEFVNNDGIFSINNISGEVVTNDSFDYEVQDRYDLMAVVHSGNSYEQLDFEVRVVDLNDNLIEIIDKELHFKIFEDENPEKKIGQIRAYDKDFGDKVYYHLVGESKIFDVGLTDGIITLISKVDREIRESYLLEVYVSNKETVEDTDLPDNTNTAFVHIEIIDVDDSGPIFEREVYLAAVKHDALAGTKLLTVKASDPDKNSTTNSVFYRIDEVTYKNAGKARQLSGFVIIDEKTGQISLGRSPREFDNAVFECKIVSADSPALSAHFAYAQLQLRYLKTDDQFQLNSFRAQFIVINETAAQVLDANEAVDLIDKNARSAAVDNKLKLFTSSV
uniref:Cadherin domain-containing protein n=1 Tax=Syphacia muris TaxID=451379 RepID=A0A0N5AZF9_9BILA